MPNMIEHVEYLSQHVGPRPAGTEEEQQAASYIEERLNEVRALSVAVEDFSAAASADAPRCVCSLVTLVFAVLSLVLPVLTIPAILLTAVSAALMIGEVLSKPVLSKLFARGVSQNVVAKYEPGYSPDGAPARRRKIVVVSHYDSGKVRSELSGPILAALPVLRKVEVAALVLVPIVILLKGVVFSHAAQSVSLVLTVVLTILVVVVALPVLAAAGHKFAAYNDGANCNASGTAVLLDVAARVGNAWSYRDEEPAEFGGVIHGEDAALASGLVPEGAQLVYEVGAVNSPEPVQQSPEVRLAAAKAAVAALSGKPVSTTVSDISSQLVQVKDEPVSAPSQSEISALRAETREAFASIPPETVSDALSAAAMKGDAAEAMSSWFGEEAGAEGSASGSGASAASAAQGVSRGAGEGAAAVAATAAGAASTVAGAAAAQSAGSQAGGSVPDWFKKAQEKAKRPKEETPVHRSRYADALDAAERLGVQGNQVVPMEASASDGLVVEQLAGTGSALEGVSQSEGVPAAGVVGHAGASVSVASPVSVPAARADIPSEGASGFVAADDDAGFGMPRAVTEGVAPNAGVGDYGEAFAAGGADSVDAAQAGATRVMAPIGVEPLREEDSASEVSSAAEEDGSAERARRRGGFALPSFLKERAARDKREVAGRTTNRVEVSAGQIAESEQRQPEQRQPITLPSIGATASLPPIAEMQKQRAPLAEAAVSGKSTAKHLLNMLPSIDLGASSAAAQTDSSASSEEGADANGRAQLRASLPSLSGALASVGAGSDEADALDRGSVYGNDPFAAAAPAQHAPTGAFVPGATGSFAPVSDELLKNVDPEDIYVDDADDSGYEGTVTETGAFAGPGYVDMPKSRAHRFFDKFHFGRRKKEEESTPQEWLQVDEEFDARTVGAARGGWESFRQDDGVDGAASTSGANAADLGATQAFAPYSPEELGGDSTYDDTYSGSYDNSYDGSYDASYTGYGDSAEGSYGEFPGDGDGFSDDDDLLFGSRGFAGDDSFPSADDTFADSSFGGMSEEGAGEGRASRKKRLWHGGAFSRRMMKSEAALSEEDSSGAAHNSAEYGEEPYGHTSRNTYDHDVYESAGRDGRDASGAGDSYEYGYESMPSQLIDDGVEQVYRFRDQAINTEVWFVALGSGLAGNGGMNAFLSEHAQDLRGAIVIELEGLGAGTLSLVEREGAYRSVSFSSRMKRYVKKASRVLGESVPSVKMCWRDSAASVAGAHGLQAMHLVGAQGGKPALYGQNDDVLDNVEEETMLRNSDFVMELLKNI